MNNGYPTGGAAAASPGRLSGGAAAAFYTGGRAAAMMARALPWVGAALTAYELARFLRGYIAGLAAHTGFTGGLCPAHQTCANGGVGWTGIIGYNDGAGTCCAIAASPTGVSADTDHYHAVGQYVTTTTRLRVEGTWSRNVGYTAAPVLEDQPARPPLPLYPPGTIPLSHPQARKETFPWAPADEKKKPAPAVLVSYLGLGLEWAPSGRAAGYSSANAWAPWRPGVGTVPWVPPRSIPLSGVIAAAPELQRPGVMPIAPGAGAIAVPGVGAGVVSRPGVTPRVAPFPVVAFPARPAPGTREVKAQVTAAMATFSSVFGAPGEVGDFVGALHDALPPCRKTRSPAALRQAGAARRAGGWDKKYRKADISDVQKILDIASFANALANNPNMRSADVCRGIGSDHHWTDGRPASGRGTGDFARDGGRLDHAASQFMERAMRNLVKNEITDRSYGAVGKRLGGISRELGLPVGLQTMRKVASFKLG